MVKHSVFRNITAVQTHPLDRKKPCYLVRELEVPRGKKTLLQLKVSHHPHGDWQLRVLAVESWAGSGPRPLVKEKDKRTYSTVTLLARFLGLSTSQPRRTAM